MSKSRMSTRRLPVMTTVIPPCPGLDDAGSAAVTVTFTVPVSWLVVPWIVRSPVTENRSEAMAATERRSAVMIGKRWEFSRLRISAS